VKRERAVYPRCPPNAREIDFRIGTNMVMPREKDLSPSFLPYLHVAFVFTDFFPPNPPL
jgi:hypothetical protein